MTPEQQVAFIFSQSIAALIEMESMKVANIERESNGLALAYDEAAFLALINQYGIGHNSVLTLFES